MEGMKKTMEDERSRLTMAIGESPVKCDPIYYINAVKQVFGEESEKYDQFVGIMKAYRTKRFDLQSVKDRIKKLFKGHRGLLVSFNAFLPKEHEISLPPKKKKKPQLDDAVDFVAKLKSFPSVYKSFAQCLCSYRTMKMSPEVTRRELSALFSNYPDLQLEFNRFKPAGFRANDCEPCTPSYRFIPKDRPVALASCRTSNDIQVLNDSLKSVRTGRENRSFKHMHKNEHEYNLFRCDDDRFEFDMLLKTMYETITRVEKLMKNIAKVNIPIHLEDYLTAGNIRCIERLYGDHGLEVIQDLRDRPNTALPVVLHRLKQKQEEARKCQTDFNVIWAAVFVKDFHKSLDYRGSYFKEQDAKSLSNEALLAEIKKSSGFKRKDKHTMIPRMEFEYPDPNIHDDIYQLINYSCQQRYKPQHLDNVMRLWTNFLEPLLGVPPRLSTSEDAEDVLPAQNRERHVSPLVIKIQTCQQVYVEEPKSEREEGELSPEEDYDVHSFAAYNDSVDREASCNSKDKDRSRQHEMRNNEEEYNGREGKDYDTDAQYEAYEIADTDSKDNGSVYRLSDNIGSATECEYSDEDGIDESEGKHVECNGVLRFFYGNDSFYILFRLHHMMYKRLHTAKLCSSSTTNNWRAYNDTDSADRRYARFVNALRNLVNGSSDQEKFEHDCLTILGAESYILFTLDKLIFRIIEQMHGIVTREIDSRILRLYSHESSRKSGRFMDNRYKEKARYLLPQKNIFCLEYIPEAAQLFIQLMNP